MSDTQDKNNELPLDGIKEYKREIKEFSGRNVVFFYLEGKEHVLEKEHKIRRFVKKEYFVNGYKESKYYFSNPESWNDSSKKGPVPLPLTVPYLPGYIRNSPFVVPVPKVFLKAILLL